MIYQRVFNAEAQICFHQITLDETLGCKKEIEIHGCTFTVPS